jgi:hypothetical protein
MADKDHKQNATGPRGMGNDNFDREFDAALAKFAAATPRAGLEERVLANLRAERGRVPDRSWWRWSVIAAVAVVAVVAVALALRSGKPRQEVTANPPRTTTPGPHQPEKQIVSKNEVSGVQPPTPGPRRKAGHPRHSSAALASQPKLDQFPSPQPLSEQEKLLASYVAQFHEQAVLVARARAEIAIQDREREVRFAPGIPETDESQQESNRTNR